MAEYERAIFAAGCFWGVEAEFRRVKGVISIQVGYSGGATENPGYQDVSTGQTGHAEAVEIRFDPAIVSYEDLLEVFWRIHDPTSLNRQGPDVGTQYRSAIFYTTPEQKAKAQASKVALERSGRFKKPIVTEIKAASTFFRAEEYHQQFFERMGQRML
jgi:peptide-methionine (S)-S-oxide reductase